MGPGHPLFDTLIDWTISEARPAFARGAILVDPNIARPQRVWLVRSTIDDERRQRRQEDHKVSAHERFAVVVLDHLGLRATSPSYLLNCTAPEAGIPTPEIALKEAEEIQAWAYDQITERQLEHVKATRSEECDLRRQYLNTAFTDLILELQEELNDLQQAQLFGDDNAEDRERLRRRIEELGARKTERLKELELMLKLSANLPDLLTEAVIAPVPVASLEEEDERPSKGFPMHRDDEVEVIAMDVAMRYERSRGWEPTDVSQEGEHYDVRSESQDGEKRFIEVKGRAQSGEIVLTSPELDKLNQARRARLALRRHPLQGGAATAAHYPGPDPEADPRDAVPADSIPRGGERLGTAGPGNRDSGRSWSARPMNGDGAFRWDDGLTGPARNMAGMDHTPIRVLAGPGTGKTFALMRRVARLLQDGTTANRMLVCTFTRTAAKDLERGLSDLGVDAATAVRSGTLHAFCFGLLGREDVLEATGRVPRPLLAIEERFLLEDMSDAKFGNLHDRRRRLQAFNAAWARLQSETPGWPAEPVDQAFQRKLFEWLRFHEAMLIGEVVPESLRYLRENPASQHRGVFEHVLVDEYQDLNRAEQELLDLLAEAGQLIVIGDENQSIYSFKLAHPEGISTFDQSHPGTPDEELDECRRCPRLVVKLANTLIANNRGRAHRALTPRPGNPHGDVFILQWPSMEEEAQGIAEIIRSQIENEEVEPGRVLVLAPRRQFGYAVRDALNAHGVFAHSFFHEQALDNCDAQQAFILLALLANREDRVALRCWCGFGGTSLRSPAWGRLRAHCEENGESPWGALVRLASTDLAIPYTRPLVNRFQELQRRLEELKNSRGQALVDAFFPEDEDWASTIRALAATIEGDVFDAEELHEDLRVRITQPELPTDVDYVRVMSLHKSKGLTADVVVVVGCVEGLVPTLTDGTLAEQAKSLEEQRRLFYVAITRTRRVLVISSVTQLPRKLAYSMGAQVHGGNPWHSPTIASRFLNELGPDRPAAKVGSCILDGAAE